MHAHKQAGAQRQVSHTPDCTWWLGVGGGEGVGIRGQRLSYESMSERGDWWVGCRLPWFPSLISAADLPPAMPGPGNTESVQARSPASLLSGQSELAFSEVG